MWIHRTTGRPAWLIEQGQDGGAVFSHDPPGDRTRHHAGSTAAAFFAAHREATPEELAGAKPPRLAKPKAVKGPARGRAKGPKGPRSPRKAAPAGESPPAADKPPAQAAARAGGEPHGE